MHARTHICYVIHSIARLFSNYPRLKVSAFICMTNTTFHVIMYDFNYSRQKKMDIGIVDSMILKFPPLMKLKYVSTKVSLCR